MNDDEAVLKLLEKAVEKLHAIDRGIDFLAAAITGATPVDIQLGQQAYGPSAVKRAIASREKSDVKETINIADAVIENVIEEELLLALKEEV